MCINDDQGVAVHHIENKPYLRESEIEDSAET
jgi:hypothetical protein